MAARDVSNGPKAICQNRKCNYMGKYLPNDYFFKTRNVMMPRCPYCKECVESMINIEDIQTVYDVLKMLDVPFIKDIWDAVFTKYDKKYVEQYLKMINYQYSSKYLEYRFADSVFESEKNPPAKISENPEDEEVLVTLSALFEKDIKVKEEEARKAREAEELKRLKEEEARRAEEEAKRAEEEAKRIEEEARRAEEEEEKEPLIWDDTWQGEYTANDLRYLNEYYEGLNNDFKIITTNHRDYARKIAQASLSQTKAYQKLLKNEDGADAAYEKATRVFDTLSKSAQFAESQRGLNDVSLGCFGRVFDAVEKHNWVPSYAPTDEDMYDKLLRQFSNIDRSL